MKIIAFGHRQRVGKDSAGRFLLNTLRSKYPKIHSHRCSFGDEVKKIAYQMYSWAGLEEGIYYENHPELKDKRIDSLKKSPREIWIELGLKGREIYPKTWNGLALMSLPAETEIAVVTDLRDTSEVETIREFKGVCVKINRASQVKRSDGIDDKLETYLGWDYQIDNDGDLRTLNIQCCLILDTVLSKWGFQ